MLKILYFASLRERMGRSEEQLSAAEPVSKPSSRPDRPGCSARDPAGAAAFAQPSLVRAAVNQEFATSTTPIKDGDEIAFFPPVTGG